MGNNKRPPPPPPPGDDRCEKLGGKKKERVLTVKERFDRQDALLIEIVGMLKRDRHTEERHHMSTQQNNAQNFEDLRVRMTAHTSRLGALIQAYVDAKKSGDMTKEEEDAALVKFELVATNLEAMGQDPADPLPPIDPDLFQVQKS